MFGVIPDQADLQLMGKVDLYPTHNHALLYLKTCLFAASFTRQNLQLLLQDKRKSYLCEIWLPFSGWLSDLLGKAEFVFQLG